MRLRSYGVLMLGLLLAGASTAWAQVATTGSIQVIVEDPQGGRLPGVTVEVSAPDSVTTRSAVTDAEGVATLEALNPSARYIVRAQLSGFRDLERTDILVRTGQAQTEEWNGDNFRTAICEGLYGMFDCSNGANARLRVNVAVVTDFRAATVGYPLEIRFVSKPNVEDAGMLLQARNLRAVD